MSSNDHDQSMVIPQEPLTKFIIKLPSLEYLGYDLIRNILFIFIRTMEKNSNDLEKDKIKHGSCEDSMIMEKDLIEGQATINNREKKLYLESQKYIGEEPESQKWLQDSKLSLKSLSID